jgi:hypothetical protein
LGVAVALAAKILLDAWLGGRIFLGKKVGEAARRVASQNLLWPWALQVGRDTLLVSSLFHRANLQNAPRKQDYVSCQEICWVFGLHVAIALWEQVGWATLWVESQTF